MEKEEFIQKEIDSIINNIKCTHGLSCYCSDCEKLRELVFNLRQELEPKRF